MKLVLMPGMDGSGELFREFVAALQEGTAVQTLRYPTDRWVPYRELAMELLRVMPAEPFVLVAESYSVPLAIVVASMRPEGLRGMVLFAGFATSPVRGWKRDVGMRMAKAVSHLTLPGFVAEWMLLGQDAPKRLVDEVTAAVSWVDGRVLAARVREVLMVDVLRKLAEVSVAILYVQPTQDRLVDAACIEDLRMVKPARTVAIDGPHLLLQREPGLCAEVVMGFVRELG